MDSIQETILKNEAQSWHLGYNVYVHVKENNPCVDIRQYWKPNDDSDIVPTRKGLCLRPFEFTVFKGLLHGRHRKLPSGIEKLEMLFRTR